jgi:hypothetical protein
VTIVVTIEVTMVSILEPIVTSIVTTSGLPEGPKRLENQANAHTATSTGQLGDDGDDKNAPFLLSEKQEEKKGEGEELTDVNRGKSIVTIVTIDTTNRYGLFEHYCTAPLRRLRLPLRVSV